ASPPGDGAERRLAVSAADRVVDDVASAPLGQAFDALAQVFAGVVDGRVGAVLAADRELLVARGAGDDARAERLADLDRGKADAAGRAVGEPHVSAPQTVAVRLPAVPRKESYPECSALQAGESLL